VLSDFKIVINDRIMYSGRAVISNVVNTGIMLICEATLDDSWLDVDLFSSVTTPNRLREEFGQFLQEWQKIERILPTFKAAVADLQTMLMDLRRWLEQVELGIRSEPGGDRSAIERQVIAELEDPILPTVGSWFSRFDDISEKVDDELRPVHRAFAKRLLHPLVLCSPFVYRTYHKPLGYAGDYEMVNMILRDPYEGASLFAKIVNVCFLKNPPAEAHRNRIKYLTNALGEETRRERGASMRGAGARRS
jgi:extracellular factor (EF) 3-hydroxypalmitic acid methyl ester biosynthesis protein